MITTEATTNQPLLLPHQRDLIDLVLNGPESRPIYLEASPGMGKSTALRGLVAEAIRRNARARVLFVAPFAALLEQVEMQLSPTVDVTRVDRFVFREMIDRRGNDAVWNEPGVYALTLQLARVPDVRSSLLAARWDLLVCDGLWEDPDQSVSEAIINGLADVSARTIVAGRPFSSVAREAMATVVRWDKAAVTDSDGKSISPPDPSRVVLSYPVAAEVYQLRERALGGRSQPKDAEGSLAEALESSPAAAEMLALELQARSEEEGKAQAEPAVSAILRAIDTLYADGKLAALIAFVSELDPKRTGLRVCVATRFVQTAYYLASALNDVARVELLVPSERHLGDLSSERAEILVGGIRSLLTRADLELIDHLIFYDGQSSATALELIEATNAVGRDSPLTVVSLEPAVETLP